MGVSETWIRMGCTPFFFMILQGENDDAHHWLYHGCPGVWASNMHPFVGDFPSDEELHSKRTISIATFEYQREDDIIYVHYFHHDSTVSCFSAPFFT